MRLVSTLMCFVALGHHQAYAATSSAFDLCAPCAVGDHCSTNYCAVDGNGSGLCTQPCSGASDCPSAFSCTEGFCLPTTAVSCPSPYPSALNTQCSFVAINGDANTAVKRFCASGLTCYHFPTNAEGDSSGWCVPTCSTISETNVCPFGTSCCFGTDATGACLNTVTSAATNGGCFDIRDVGELCAQGNQSYCMPGSSCLYTQTPRAARCYDTCQAGLCNVGGRCETLGTAQVCCDTAKFVEGDITTCVPAPGYCRRDIGTTCEKNEQCRKGLCYKARNQSACTQPCSTDADCTTSSGAALSCQPFGSDSYCWPLNAPAPAPACANIKLDTARLLRGGGCNCRHGGGGGVGWLALALVSALQTRARRNRR